MSKLTPTQKKYIELEKKKDDYKQWKLELGEAIEEVKTEIGLLGHFQDDEGIVYQMVEPNGTFVAYHKLGINRTKRKDEKKGSLSMKAAKELGYDVK